MHDDPDIDLRVLAYSDSEESSFGHDIMGNVDWVPLTTDIRSDAGQIRNKVLDFDPDVVVIAGWLNSAYVKLTKAPELSNKRFVMAMDTPWQGTWRQRLAPYVLQSYISKLDAAVVTGERAWIYGRKLGIEEGKLFKGQYGVDYRALSELFRKRASARWPKQFLFVGRYSEEKGIADLVAAYEHYRRSVSDPWTLVCCGKGELETLLDGVPGISNRGFVQPTELHEILVGSGALIMPSHFDPWPLALVEACAAGLPIVATYACGSAVECVRSEFNGYMCATADSHSLASALIKTHSSYDDLPSFGERSKALVSAYSTEYWLKRWKETFSSVCLPPS